ncbi:hypothetical protein ACIBJC_23305 [Streptomyces sp. NPDC050509]|uniref:hypothetical protein n=1 Tax=Streptomyces sp. NPDC050509 TaxID=3365620 RepID=UPI0037AB39A9
MCAACSRSSWASGTPLYRRRRQVLEGGLDLHRADAVGAVEEAAPGGHGSADVASAEADAAEVGEDDGAGAAAVEAVDVEGQVEMFLGSVEVAETGEDHAGSWAHRPGE